MQLKQKNKSTPIIDVEKTSQ